MATRIIAVIILVAFLNGLIGCSHIITVPKDELKGKPQQYILSATLTSGKEMNFEPPGGVFVPEREVIRGAIRDSLDNTKAVEIELDDIRSARVRRSDEKKNTMLLLGGCLSVSVVLLIAFIGYIQENLK